MPAIQSGTDWRFGFKSAIIGAESRSIVVILKLIGSQYRDGPMIQESVTTKSFPSSVGTGILSDFVSVS